MAKKKATSSKTKPQPNRRVAPVRTRLAKSEAGSDLVKFNRKRANQIARVRDDHRKGRGVSDFSIWGPRQAKASAVGRRRRRSRILSLAELRLLSIDSPTIRPCIDQIVREVAFLPWRVFPRKTENSDYEVAKKNAKQVEEFLRNPNANQESLSTIFSQCLRDLLTLDKCVILKVKDTEGNLSEIWARDPATFVPQLDKFGVILNFQQRTEGPGSSDPRTEFSPDEVSYMVLHPSTYAFEGAPIIETIANQAAGIMIAYKDVVRMWDEDEIPPGVLVLGKIGEEALERAKASFTKTRGIRNRFKLRVIDNIEKGGAEWVAMRRSNRDEQLLELVKRVEHVIFRNFGLSPVDMGEVGRANRAESYVQYAATGSRMITPLSNMLAYYINDQIISEFKFEDISFGFLLKPRQISVNVSQGIIQQWRAGLISRNEARLELGRDPITGGDVYTVLLGNEVVRIDDEGVPQYRNGSPTPTITLPAAQADRVVAALTGPDGIELLEGVHDRENPFALDIGGYGA